MLRVCQHCGKVMLDGMTDLEYFYTHEGECFEKEMDKIYGKHQWIVTENEGDNFGYYAYEEDGELIDTGIFYTTWESDEIEKEDVETLVQNMFRELIGNWTELVGHRYADKLNLPPAKRYFKIAEAALTCALTETINNI